MANEIKTRMHSSSIGFQMNRGCAVELKLDWNVGHPIGGDDKKALERRADQFLRDNSKTLQAFLNDLFEAVEKQYPTT